MAFWMQFAYHLFLLYLRAMTKLYQILRIVASGRVPASVKLLGLATMHALGRRTIGIFIDPNSGCNLQCKMCYFSDPKRRSEIVKGGIMSDEDIDKVEKALFHRALKLQIGCGTEPTLFPRLQQLVERAKRAGIPYISLTTNGQLLVDNPRLSLRGLVEAGLCEITLSMHGTSKEVYEELMPGARFEKLVTLIAILTEIKRDFPEFKIRVNYTVNSLNITDLYDGKFWRLWNTVKPDIIQLRPVQNMGDSAWQDFDLTPLKENYNCSFGEMAEVCRKNGITLLAPTLAQIDSVATLQDGTSAIIEDFSYCFVSANQCYKQDFDINSDTYERYHKRHRTAWNLVKAAFKGKKARARHASKKLNYTVS